MASTSRAGATAAGAGDGDGDGDAGVAVGADSVSFGWAAGGLRVVVVVVRHVGEVFHALEFFGGGLEGAFLGGGGLIGQAGGNHDHGVDAPAPQVVAQGAFVAGDEHQFGKRVLFRAGFIDGVRAGPGVAPGHLLKRLDDLLADLVAGVGGGHTDTRVGLVLVGEHQPEDHDENDGERNRQKQRAPVGEKLREVGAVEFAEGFHRRKCKS